MLIDHLGKIRWKNIPGESLEEQVAKLAQDADR
jgi:hypothetical protein